METAVWKEWVEAHLLQIEHFVTAGQMAAEVAHQINNSLEGIKNYLYLLRQDVPQLDQNPSTQIIEDEIYRIAELCNQLASFRQSRPPPGIARPAAVRSVLERVLRLLASRLRRLGVQVQWDSFDETFASASPQELTQIFYNLLLNALESMPEGGRLHLGAHRHHGGLTVVLRDEGRGIEPEALEHVFEPFYTSKPQGLGLGLTACRSLAQCIGARLELKSQPGVGTAAALYLPPEPDENRSADRGRGGPTEF